MPADDALDPARFESQTFDVVRRGFDPTSVRASLQEAAQEIRRLQLERDELVGRLAEVDGDAGEHLEAHRVASALGSEATQVLESAHRAATERAERAEREADAVRDAAIAAADVLRSEAQTARDDLMEEARREAETTIEEGRQRGREMVNEAQTVRERMLRDLARKRQTGRAQVEQLRAGRDRLLESLTTAQDSLDTAVDDLVNSVPEARAAAERAGLRITSESTPTPNDLEAEIESARLVGHPIIDDLPEAGALDSDPFPTGETEVLAHLDDVIDAAPGEETRAGAPGDEQDVSDADDKDPATVSDADDKDPATVSDADDKDPATVSDADTELYDVEAESERGGDAGDDLFDRLRSESEFDGEEASDGGSTARDDEPSNVDATEEADPEKEPRDERTVALDTAVEAASRAMKKVLIEEQGSLLDGIRRNGADAVKRLLGDTKAHESSYNKAATPALRALVAELGGPKRLGLKPALAQIHVIVLEPVRQRLAEVAERVDDPDELSDTVRALYRESRSRRISEAAAAAAVAVDGLVVLAGAEGSVRWVVEDDGPCGPDCADNALAGDVKAGDEFPTGDRHPPAHAACTCRLVVDASTP